MQFSALDQQHMQSALELAKQGQGHVEPNPMVGCVIAAGQHVLGRGFHARFGGDHAEVAALCSVAADQDLTPATMYVTLEPCCHKGKTPPCTNAIVSSGIRRVVVAARDPFAAVDGRGIEVLQQAGVTVEVGLLGDSAQDLIAPFTKRVRDRLPWMIAKWAMSLDGRIATYRGDSQWISNDKSRAIAHQLRGRMDAILIGVGTALADDPRLTARPPGPRVAIRVVVDSAARLAPDSQLCQTAREVPTLVAVGPAADPQRLTELDRCGCEIWQGQAENQNQRLQDLLSELSQREITNVLVEGGGHLLGSLFALNMLDEAHIFIGDVLLGGQAAMAPIGGQGKALVSDGLRLKNRSVQLLDSDIYIQGRIDKAPHATTM